MGKVAVQGFVQKGFERVEDIFAENFRSRREVGAAVSVFVEGEKVVDLWGGFADRMNHRPWLADTKALVFSSTKGLSSLAFAMLHSKGLLDYDAPVASYWPEFAASGKEAITVRQLLAHEAGLMVIDRMLYLRTLRDKDKLADVLARQKPQAGMVGQKGYHTWTIGLYQSELCRRIDPLGRSIGTLFHDEIAIPLDADFHIGIPADIKDAELAQIIPFKTFDALRGDWKDIPLGLIFNFWNPAMIPFRSFMNPPIALAPLMVNQRNIRELEIGSVTGVGTARAMAKIYGEFACGGRRLNVDSGTISELERLPDNPNNAKDDLVLKEQLIYSLGLEKPSSFFDFGSSPQAYGHQGAGGSAAFADPAQRLGFAYIMNRMGTCIANDPREKALRSAVYQCL